MEACASLNITSPAAPRPPSFNRHIANPGRGTQALRTEIAAMAGVLPSVAQGHSAKQLMAARRTAAGSLRVRPFTSIAPQRQQKLLQRVNAEPEEAAPAEAAAAAPEAAELDFEFNFNDAKKNNTYQQSDVDAAMRYYNDGEGVMDYDNDFVSNPLVAAVEDSSVLAHLDDNEAYEGDEFVAAGIPEAAPKKQRRGDGKEDVSAGDDNEDLVSAAKQRSAEDEAQEQMLAMDDDEWALQDDSKAAREAFGDDLEDEPDTQNMWDWMETAQQKLPEASALVVAEDDGDAFALGNIPQENLDLIDPSVRDTMSFLVDDFDVTKDLEMVATEAELGMTEADLAKPAMPSAEEKAVNDALAQRMPDLQKLEGLSVRLGPAKGSGFTEADLTATNEYIASLERMLSSDEAPAMSADDLKKMLAEQGIELKPTGIAGKDASSLLKLPAMPARLTAADLKFIDDDMKMDAAENGEVDYFVQEELSWLEATLADKRSVLSEDDFPRTPEEEQQRAALLDQLQYEVANVATWAESGAAPSEGDDAFAAADPEAEGWMDDELDAVVEAYDGYYEDEQWQERVLELRRVTKVTKGGKVMGFRGVAVIGNGKGLVGVGCAAGREVTVAVKRALADAKKNVVRVNLVGGQATIPHKSEAKYHSGHVVLVPASDGTGCIAGGAVRAVLELAGVRNVLSKCIGSRSYLNSARATVKALATTKTLYEVSSSRGIPLQELLI